MSDSESPAKHSDASRTFSGPSNPKKPGHGSGVLIWVIVIAVIVVAVLVWLLVHHGAESASGQSSRHGGGRGGMGPTVVSTTKVQTGNIGVYVSALGSVTPLNTVGVNSRVAGQIMKIDYQEGQFVKKGDPLLMIDPGPNKAALVQAEGQLERDSALLENAKLDLERYQEAYTSNAIPKQQLDTQSATVHQDEGTVKLDQGELDNAKVQLAYCYISAPIAGRIGLRLVDEGNIVQANSTNLVIITQLQPISVIFDVAEDFLPEIQQRLREGSKLTVAAFDRANLKKLATGTLETIDNQINPTTGTVQFRAVFDNQDEFLFPNQFVNARLLVTTHTNVELLPNTAIQIDADNNSFVYTIGPADTNDTNQTAQSSNEAGTNSAVASKMQSAKITMKTIKVGTTDGTVSEVEGLEPGTEVVADNFNRLSDGVEVMLRPASVNSTNETDEASASGTNQTNHAWGHKRQKKTSQ